MESNELINFCKYKRVLSIYREIMSLLYNMTHLIETLFQYTK